MKNNSENLDDSKLAIHGGTAMFPSGPPSWPVATDEIRESVLRSLYDGSWGSYESELTDRLADRLCQLTATQNAMLCSSGTIAVELALRSVGVTSDHEIILSGYDFPGNFRAIEAIGATPVLVDTVTDGWIMDPNLVAAAVSESTKAILVSHLHGQLADIPAIRAAATAAGNDSIAIVEDVCQMPGGRIGDQPLGSFGDSAAFSFGGSKLLSAGRGGAIVSNSAQAIQRAKIFANRGNEAFPLSQIQAAALLPQLEVVESTNENRHQSVLRLLEQTSPLTGLTGLTQTAKIVCEQSVDYVPGYYKLPWLLNTAIMDCTRAEFIAAIQAEGVAIDIGFRGFTTRSARRCRKPMPLPNAKRAADDTLLLHHPVLIESNEIIDRVARAITKVHNAMAIEN